MNDFKYNLKLTDNQARVIMVALEDYFRTRLNQWDDFTDEIALNGYKYDRSNPDNDRLFNEYINRRNDSREMFRKAYEIAAPNVYERGKTKDIRTAIDVWHVIRYQKYLERPEPKSHYTVDAYPPRPETIEPLPTIERITKGND